MSGDGVDILEVLTSRRPDTTRVCRDCRVAYLIIDGHECPIPPPKNPVKWIRCSDRMPTDEDCWDSRIAGLDEDGYACIALLVKGRLLAASGEIVAWCPLPFKEYKGE